MMDVTVEVTYTFHFKVEDETEAVTVADGAIQFIVTNPQTGERVTPEVEAYQEG